MYEKPPIPPPAPGASLDDDAFLPLPEDAAAGLSQDPSDNKLPSLRVSKLRHG